MRIARFTGIYRPQPSIMNIEDVGRIKKSVNYMPWRDTIAKPFAAGKIR
jgi:hypothetical protein